MRRIIHLVLILGMVAALLPPAQAGLAQDTLPPAQKAIQLLQQMTPEEKVGQLFLVTFEGTEVDSQSQIYELIVENHIGGVILRSDNNNFSGPTGTVNKATELVRALQNNALEASRQSITNPVTGTSTIANYVPLFIGISQEGDLYPNDQILTGMTPLPSLMTLGATWDPALAQATGEVMGRELYAMGFNFYLGPSLDVLNITTTTLGDDLGTRTFGGDPYWVGEMGKAYVRGLHTGGNNQIIVIAKHFPGRGESDRLPEEEVATVRKSLDQLRQFELAPFFTVTGNEDAIDNIDGLLVSHIRYQIQGNIRATTPPTSLDNAALSQLLDLEPVSRWHSSGGLIVSDNLGSDAVRKFYDPTGRTFDARRVARNAFLAGNDLLYLDNFIEPTDTDEYTTIKRTLDSFVQKYREDPAFAERVEQSVLRILIAKYTLYPEFGLEDVIPPASLLAEVGQSSEITFESARQSVTLISPGQEDLNLVLPRPPDPTEKIIFFTDVQTGAQCETCETIPVITVDALKNAVTRLYGPGAGGQIISGYLTAYSLLDLQSYLNDPEGTAALAANLSEADWVVFSILSPNMAFPESTALKRLLSERPDLLRNKRVIVFAFNAPYHLDATDISKVTAYYGLYSKSSPFVDMAARMLFQELPPLGALPVSVPGVGYDIFEATSPDSAQLIPLFIDLPEPSPDATTATPEPTLSPVFRLGDTIPLRTGVIFDHNRNPVPDGTVVRFLITTLGEIPSVQQIETTTVNGIARATYPILNAVSVEIRVVSDPAVTSQILAINISNGEQAAVTAFVPTSFPTETPSPEPTPTDTPEPTPMPVAPEPFQPGFSEWLIALLMVWGGGFGIYQVGRRTISVRWGIRWGLMGVIGGMFAYVILVLEWITPISWFLEGGSTGVILATLVGILVGWGIGVAWHRWLIQRNPTGRKVSAAK